jgi:hypothetical protein
MPPILGKPADGVLYDLDIEEFPASGRTRSAELVVLLGAPHLANVEAPDMIVGCVTPVLSITRSARRHGEHAAK